MTNVADQDPTEPRAEDLTDEITRKYDPERLLKMISKRAGKGETLDHSVRNKYEQKFGVDLGHVRVYTGEFAEEFNKKRDAHAVTIGSTGIILMGGTAEKSMATSAGQSLLAHELTHVAQAQRAQGGGLHRKSSFNNAMPFTQEHEDEAEHVEHEEAHGGGGDAGGPNASAAATPAANAQKAKVDAKAKLDEAIEKVKARVLDMAADAARCFSYRNGLARRP